jgi:prolyl 4-hydroxylase
LKLRRLVVADIIAEARRRADAADSEAVAFTAVLAGLGAGERQSWPVAMARLRRAAELGSAAAAEQLEVLGRGIEQSLAPAPRERLLEAPRISVARAFLAPSACHWLIERSRGRIRRAQVFDADSGAGRIEDARRNSAFEFQFEDLDVVVLAVRAKIAATVRMPVQALEPVQTLHYAPGESFELHVDFLDPQEPAYAPQLRRFGQRVATFLVYLNDGYEGGETDFPVAGLRFKGEPGDALMFANVDPAGQPDRTTLHAGLPPASGEKWILSQWIRDRIPA